MNNSKTLRNSTGITILVTLMSVALALPSEAASPPEAHLTSVPPTVLHIDTQDGSRLYIITGAEQCRAFDETKTCTIDILDIQPPYEYAGGAASAELSGAMLHANSNPRAGWSVESVNLIHAQGKMRLTVTVNSYVWETNGTAWTNGFSYQAFVLARLRR